MKYSTFSTHLLPPKSDPPIERVPAVVALELQSYIDQARVKGMQQIDDLVYYNSNSDGEDDNDDDDTFYDAIQVNYYLLGSNQQ